MERIISRSLERGATALAAYYTAEKIQDIRTEVLHDYRKKKVLFESIFLGEGFPQQLNTCISASTLRISTSRRTLTVT